MARLLRLPAIALAALVTAAPAHAAYTPKFVATGSGADTTVKLTWPDADDPTAKATIYVPGPYTLGTPATGAEIGDARLVMIAKELGNTRATLTGAVTVTDPTATAIRTTATQCTGVPTHEQVWIATVSIGGTGQNPIRLHVFVDRTAGAEAALGGAKLQFCFGSPDIPPAQGGQPLGGKPTEALLTVHNVLAAPDTPGDYVWRSLLTPYRPGTAVANAAGTIEAQSIVRVPRRAALNGKILVKTRKVRGETRRTFSVQLTARAIEGEAAIGGVTIQIFRGTRRVKTGKTNEEGKLVVTLALKKTVTFRARASVRERTTSCRETPVAPAGCTGATVGGFSLRSNSLKVTLPRLRRQ